MGCFAMQGDGDWVDSEYLLVNDLFGTDPTPLSDSPPVETGQTDHSSVPPPSETTEVYGTYEEDRKEDEGLFDVTMYPCLECKNKVAECTCPPFVEPPLPF